jgi:ComF family protein
MYGRIINDIAKDQGFDMLIAIPIHNRKRRERGYNQAFQFARGLSESLGIPVHENVLIRKVYSISQTKKNRSERYENVEGVFSINPQYSMLEDKHVALVDDILTTGATLSEAGRILKLSGAKVSVLTIARA